MKEVSQLDQLKLTSFNLLKQINMQEVNLLKQINMQEVNLLKQINMQEVNLLQQSAIVAVTVPGGASVFIDGSPILEKGGMTPLIIHEVSAGRHVVTFRLAGYFDELVNVNIPKGGYLEVSTRLRPI